MVANLVLAKIDLNWADEQYWTTLLKVLGDITDIMTPKQKKKINPSEASKYVK